MRTVLWTLTVLLLVALLVMTTSRFLVGGPGWTILVASFSSYALFGYVVLLAECRRQEVAAAADHDRPRAGQQGVRRDAHPDGRGGAHGALRHGRRAGPAEGRLSGRCGVA